LINLSRFLIRIIDLIIVKLIFVFSFLLILASFNGFSQNLENQLFELPDVIFEKHDNTDHGMVYQLKVKQALDHSNPDAGHFYQKVFLTHRGFDRPNVIVTEGYSCRRNRVYELTTLLNANQIQVEHRYFGESIPDSLDYKYLNLEQATADLHKINQLMRKLYAGKWVSTGISKGGATTIFYRYFYPDDVDVSVPYVAPINYEFEEQRIYDFLDSIGTTECRSKIKEFQFRMLVNSEEIMPWIYFYSQGAKLDFNYLTMEQAFELAILEYPFSFWQWGHQCEDIPTEDIPLILAVEYLLDVSGVDFFSDKMMATYASHYYQSATEMGYYGYEIDEFQGLLKALPTNVNPHAAFVPDKMEFEFDGSLLDQVNAWLEENGNEFIYIYGALDTWSASAVPISEKVDAIWFFMKDKHHGNARIRNLSDVERARLISNLERWLKLEIE